MNPTSAFDIAYKGMDEETRERLQADLDRALTATFPNIQAMLAKEIEKLVERLNSELIVNPWPSMIEENGGLYEFISAMQKQMWKLMLKSDPSAIGEWDMRELVKAWREKFPEQWAEVVNAEAARDLKALQERLDFEIRVSRSRY